MENNLINVAQVLSELIPEGTNTELEIDGTKFLITKENGVVSIASSINTEEEFDDAETKKIVDAYKKNIEELDDDLFVQAVEDLATKINLQEFDDLLELKHFDEDQADKVENMVETSIDIIRPYLLAKIVKLMELYDKF